MFYAKGCAISNSQLIIGDMPQGSVLSPYLLTICVNELVSDLPPALTIAYANDLTRFIQGQSDHVAKNALQMH